MTSPTVFSVREALPSFYQEEYPLFVTFLERYFEWMQSPEGLGDVLLKLKSARDIDSGLSSLLAALRAEYGPDFPQLASMPDSVAIRVFETWYRSKGTRESIEAYFRLFLNESATVTFPRENILRIDDGNWDEDQGIYDNEVGLLDNSTMVLQDDYFYQAFSYLVKSGVSIIDWGDVFEKIAHPSGWIYFGKVEIESLAKFEFNGLSPTYVPGRQFLTVLVELFSSAAIGSTAFSQKLNKRWIQSAAPISRNLRYDEIATNLLLSTFTVADLADVTPEDLASTNVSDIQQRPARVDIAP